MVARVSHRPLPAVASRERAVVAVESVRPAQPEPVARAAVVLEMLAAEAERPEQPTPAAAVVVLVED